MHLLLTQRSQLRISKIYLFSPLTKNICSPFKMNSLGPSFALWLTIVFGRKVKLHVSNMHCQQFVNLI